MQAGRLRDRVVILNATTVRSPSGHPVETMTEGATIWAEVKGISGRERISGGAETAQATVRVWMRFRRDVTATSCLKVLTGAFKGAILSIDGPPICFTGGRCCRFHDGRAGIKYFRCTGRECCGLEELGEFSSPGSFKNSDECSHC